MSDRITKTQRLLDLIAFLAARRIPASIDEVMEGVPAYTNAWSEGTETDRNSVRRKFERDKDELRGLGIPVETVEYNVSYGREQIQGYRLQSKDFYLPYLRLVGRETGSEYGASGTASGAGALPGPGSAESAGTVELTHEEAQVALEALRVAERLPGFPLKSEARSAFRKLAFDLDPAAFGQTPVLFAERPGQADLQALLEPLTDAVMAQKRVRFRYAGMYRDASTDRDLAPYGILFQRGHWYLIGHDALRDAIRVFRVARMSDLNVTTDAPDEPDFEVPDGFQLSDYADRSAWELGGADEKPLEALIHFRFPTSLWANVNSFGELVEEDDDGSTLRRFEVQSVNPFLRWILSLEGQATVRSPVELQNELRSMAADVAECHAEERLEERVGVD